MKNPYLPVLAVVSKASGAINSMQALSSRHVASPASLQPRSIVAAPARAMQRQSHVVRVMEIKGEAQWEAEVLKVCGMTPSNPMCRAEGPMQQLLDTPDNRTCPAAAHVTSMQAA